MLTLGMDTSSKYLVLVLMDENGVIDSVVKDCFKHQSEEIFPCLISMMERNNFSSEDITSIVVTEGPGSYTGVRIAMTIAKVFASLKNIPLYTIGTLQLFAGTKNCRVVMDARGHRMYTALLDHGEYIKAPHVLPVDEYTNENIEIVGDGSLVGQADTIPDFASNFFDLKNKWLKAENIDLVTPEYLKSSEAYLTK